MKSNYCSAGADGAKACLTCSTRARLLTPNEIPRHQQRCWKPVWGWQWVHPCTAPARAAAPQPPGTITPPKNLAGRYLPPLQMTPAHKWCLKHAPAAQGAFSCASWTRGFWGASEQGWLCWSLGRGLSLAAHPLALFAYHGRGFSFFLTNLGSCLAFGQRGGRGWGRRAAPCRSDSREHAPSL